MEFQLSHFQAYFSDKWGIYCEITFRWMPIDLIDNESSNGLVPSGNKPLPEPMLTQI